MMAENNVKANEPFEPRHAYVDAYGDPGLDLDKNATTTMFIVAAIVVDGGRVNEIAAASNAIREKHFGSGPMKSKRVDDEKRITILSELNALDFRFSAVALDKTRVLKDGDLLYPGLRYRRSFVKFVHSKLFDRLYSRDPNLRVLCDRYGYPEFMESFRQYVLSKREDLFYHPTFEFEASANSVMIQVADFIAGSLARIYDSKKLSSRAQEIHDLLRVKALKVIDWPKRFRAPTTAIRLDSEFDDKVRNYCLEHVYEYLREHSDSEDVDVAARVDALEYLLYWYESEHEDAWVPTHTLREYLSGSCPQPISVHHLRSKIIAPLRDGGVMIASSNAHGGYKIPACVRDVLSFAERYEGIVVPMLNRLRSAREALFELTDGGLDILAEDRFRELREALDGRVYGATPQTLKKAG